MSDEFKREYLCNFSEPSLSYMAAYKALVEYYERCDEYDLYASRKNSLSHAGNLWNSIVEPIRKLTDETEFRNAKEEALRDVERRYRR